MTTETRPISKAKCRETLREIIKENPDRVNPSNNYTCLYHKGRGANIERCLIGEMAWRMGLPTPRPDAGPANEVEVWNGLFTESALEFITQVQRIADTGGNSIIFDDVDPVRWGNVRLTLPLPMSRTA